VFSGVELSSGAVLPQFGKSFLLVRDGWELFRVAYLKKKSIAGK